MPELPEVETMCRGIAGIVGSCIHGVRRPRSRLQPIKISPPLKNLRRRVMGKRIVAVRRVGKRVVVDLDSTDAIIFEPRMTGRVLLVEPPDTEHVRLVFDLNGGPNRQLLFWNMRGLGVVRLYSAEQFSQHLGPDKLGPDALDVSVDTLCGRLAGSRRVVKVALMDQRTLAGIGNIYASEILHRARLHPDLPCRDLRPIQWRRLQAAISEVLHAAIRLQGSTLADGNYRNAENQPGGYQNEHRVYRRAGERCFSCAAGRIRRIVQAQRSTFYCPICQRLGPKR